MSARIPVWSRVAFLVLLPFAVYSVWDYIESRRLESRLAAIERLGQPLDIRTPVPVGDALQADRLYRAATALVTGSKDLEANKQALEFVDRAADLPFGGFMPGTSYNLQTSDLVRLARLLEYRSAVALDQHKADAALASFYSEARLVRAIEANPTAMGVGLARFSGLSAAISTSSDSGMREKLARAFSDLDRDDRPKTVLVRGRAAILSGGTPTFLGLSRRTANPMAAHILVQQLDAFASLIAVADTPWPARIDAMNAVDAWPYGFATKSPGGTTVLRNFTKSIAGQVQTIRCARLIASTAPVTLVDPFSGKPLERSQCHL